MKIELPNGVTIHLDDGESIEAVLPLLRPGDATPIAGDEIIDVDQPIPLFVRDDEDATAPDPAPARERVPRPWSKRIGVVFVTPTMLDLVRVLRSHPQGMMTTREMVLALFGEQGEDELVRLVNMLSGHVNKMVRETGLAVKIPGSLVFRITEVGSNVRLEIDAKPWLRNKRNKALMRYLREVGTD